MPCYFVSSGVEIPMTNEIFDFIWNGFGNKELNDSETCSSSEGNYKAISSAQKPTPMEKAGRRILQQKTERRKVFPKIFFFYHAPRAGTLQLSETLGRLAYMNRCFANSKMLLS